MLTSLTQRKVFTVGYIPPSHCHSVRSAKLGQLLITLWVCSWGATEQIWDCIKFPLYFKLIDVHRTESLGVVKKIPIVFHQVIACMINSVVSKL